MANEAPAAGSQKVSTSLPVARRLAKRRSPVQKKPRQGPSMAQRFSLGQSTNATRHAAALRPFLRKEFGSGAASPSEAHIQAANRLISALRKHLLQHAGRVRLAAQRSAAAPTTTNLTSLTALSEQSAGLVKLIEKIWAYYFELFGQRQTRFADWLLACDRISLDCYQVIFTGLGGARSIPSPGPFTYMETGFTPATFRRGINLSRIGRFPNPFPIVKLPYHRLVNPWTLGAIHHEVSHNIQSDLDLWSEVPRRIFPRLRKAGVPAAVARTWAKWHKEIWADLSGLLLGGPAVVASLMDVVARSRAATLSFNAAGVHPTPYLRVLISTELLRRMGFDKEAHQYEVLWAKLYPKPQASSLPPAMLTNFPTANRLVVDTICYQPYTQLGDRSLAQAAAFKPGYQQMIEEAARRLAAGVDPGIVPARFLVGASRFALENNLARPGQIAHNFYNALSQR